MSLIVFRMSASNGAACRTGGLCGGTQVLVEFANQGSGLVDGGFQGRLPQNVAHRVKALGRLKALVKGFALSL
jgi:hypothetical protein